MRVKFETVFRGAMVFLVVALACSLWAATQPATNQALVITRANPPVALAKNVERLDERYLTFWLDRFDVLREHTFLGEPIWKYPASLLYVLLAFYAARFINFIIRVWLKKLAARTETKLDDLLLELLHGPLKVVVFVGLLNIGLNMFDWPDKTKSWFSKGLIV